MIHPYTMVLWYHLHHCTNLPYKEIPRGAWVAQLVKNLPSAQVMISGSWDQAPDQASCSERSLLVPPPLFLLPILSLKSFKKSLFICLRSGRSRGRGTSRPYAECRARCGAWSQDPEIMTWAEIKSDTQPTEPSRCAPPSVLWWIATAYDCGSHKIYLTVALVSTF